MEKNIEYYAGLPYTIELRHDQAEGWFVRVKELAGCMSQGDTAEEALAMIQEAMHAWLEVSLAAGHPIPEPQLEPAYSGRFVVRVSHSLHRRLAEFAAADGVSLNQFVNVVLAQAVGQPVPDARLVRDQMGDPKLSQNRRRSIRPSQATVLHEEPVSYTTGEN